MSSSNSRRSSLSLSEHTEWKLQLLPYVKDKQLNVGHSKDEVSVQELIDSEVREKKSKKSPILNPAVS